jgi:hypothetical protein
VVDDYGVAVAAVPAGENHAARGRGRYRRTHGGADIDARVHAEAVAERIAAHPEGRGDRPGRRPRKGAGRSGVRGRRRLLARELGGAPALQILGCPARRFGSLAFANQCLEGRFLGGREVFELRHLVCHATPLRVGCRDELLTLRRERRELVFRLLLSALVIAQTDFLPLEIRSGRRDGCLRLAPLANGFLVCGDQVANVFPALDEFVEGRCGEQHVEVTDVPAFVGVDEPAPQRLVMPGEGPLCRVELDPVPSEVAFRVTDASVEFVQGRPAARDAGVGIGKLAPEVRRADGFEIELCPTPLEAIFRRLDTRLLRLYIVRIRRAEG